MTTPVKCKSCGAEIGRVDENGKVTTYDNYTICDGCEEEFCGDCVMTCDDECYCVDCCDQLGK